MQHPTPYVKWHLTDCGAGNTNGMKKKCSSFDNESIDDSKFEGGDPIASDSDRGESDDPELDDKHLDKESNSESEEEMGDVVKKTENGLVPYST